MKKIIVCMVLISTLALMACNFNIGLDDETQDSDNDESPNGANNQNNDNTYLNMLVDNIWVNNQTSGTLASICDGGNVRANKFIVSHEKDGSFYSLELHVLTGGTTPEVTHNCPSVTWVNNITKAMIKNHASSLKNTYTISGNTLTSYYHVSELDAIVKKITNVSIITSNVKTPTDQGIVILLPVGTTWSPLY